MPPKEYNLMTYFTIYGKQCKRKFSKYPKKSRFFQEDFHHQDLV